MTAHLCYCPFDPHGQASIGIEDWSPTNRNRRSRWRLQRAIVRIRRLLSKMADCSIQKRREGDHYSKTRFNYDFSMRMGIRSDLCGLGIGFWDERLGDWLFYIKKICKNWLVESTRKIALKILIGPLGTYKYIWVLTLTPWEYIECKITNRESSQISLTFLKCMHDKLHVFNYVMIKRIFEI